MAIVTIWPGMVWLGEVRLGEAGCGKGYSVAVWRFNEPLFRCFVRHEARRGAAGHGMVSHGAARAVIRTGKFNGSHMKPEAVKAMREKAGLSIAQAARCVQIADRSWQRYESGDREIPPGLVELFCMKNGLPYPPS